MYSSVKTHRNVHLQFIVRKFYLDKLDLKKNRVILTKQDFLLPWSFRSQDLSNRSSPFSIL